MRSNTRYSWWFFLYSRAIQRVFWVRYVKHNIHCIFYYLIIHVYSVIFCAEFLPPNFIFVFQLLLLISNILDLDGVDLVIVTTVLVMSMDIARMDLTLENVDHLVYKNDHVLVMLYQHNNIRIQIVVMFMETFRLWTVFLDGIFGKNHILYRHTPVVLLMWNVGGEQQVLKFQKMFTPS